MRPSTLVARSAIKPRRRGRSPEGVVLDQALSALLAQHQRAEFDAAYAAYDNLPLDEPDEWGDLQSFRAAAGSS
ncbi:MAG: antitoxin MazE5 [Acidimicrobiales bacterium]|nr:antitoxin MazE5 [Acidimicrobiales bacterium]MCB1250373.1 antitoxin MazE5 [Acidimicrobiales bacterium]